MKFVGYMIETDEEGDIIFDPEMGKQLLKHTPINIGDSFFLSLNACMHGVSRVDCARRTHCKLR